MQAQGIFVRDGFARLCMNDIAAEAEMKEQASSVSEFDEKKFTMAVCLAEGISRGKSCR
jgi:hypothetical protein